VAPREAHVEGDARRLPLASVEGPRPLRAAANLPYSVSTVILAGWLDEIARLRAEGPADALPESLTLLLQEEVARRVAAAPGSPAYGRLSVACLLQAEARLLFEVPPGSFSPPPRVRSRLVRLETRAEPLAEAPRAALDAVLRAAFGGRRKTLRRALARMPSGADALLDAAGVDGGERAERIPPEAFCAMARVLQEWGEESPLNRRLTWRNRLRRHPRNRGARFRRRRLRFPRSGRRPGRRPRPRPRPGSPSASPRRVSRGRTRRSPRATD